MIIMKKPAAKLFFLFGLYIGLHFVAAACMQCECGDTIPFFDYQALTVTANDPAAESVLKLDVTAAEISFLAAVNPCLNRFGFLPSAMGCSCNENGDQGPKFPVVSLHVFADRAFSDLLPVDSSLIALFALSQFEVGTNTEYPVFGSLIEASTVHPLRLTTGSQPKNPEQPIRFTIQVIKSNSDTVRIQTDTIRFQ